MQLQQLTVISHSATGHRAFPSLTRHGGHWWCSFRSGRTHMSHDGQAELWSREGDDPAGAWVHRLSLRSPERRRPDLRDPLVVSRGTELAIVATATSRRVRTIGCQSYVWTSPDGQSWSEPQAIVGANRWLWGLAPDSAGESGPESGDLWAVTYPFRDTGADDDQVRLWNWPAGGEPTHAATLTTSPLWNETMVIPTAAGLVGVARQFVSPGVDGGNALLGRAASAGGPWRWSDLGQFVGGPGLVEHDGQIYLGGRARRDDPYTALWQVAGLESAAPELVEVLRLPSGGDTGYPSMVSWGGRLQIAYYSSHEPTSAIYLAEVG